jgi:PII-like signaling protein
MKKCIGEKTLMRIFIGESDKIDGRPLHKEVLKTLRKIGMAGATVLHGVAGYGARSVYHTSNILRLSQDLPVVIEVVDSDEKIQEIIPILDKMLNGGMITLEKANVIMYRSGCET